MGMGVTIRFAAERVVDNEAEAAEFGRDMNDLSAAFAGGYSGEE